MSLLEEKFTKNRLNGLENLIKVAKKGKKKRVLFLLGYVFDNVMGGELSMFWRMRTLAKAGFEVTCAYRRDRDHVRKPYDYDEYGVFYDRFSRDIPEKEFVSLAVSKHKPNIVFNIRDYVKTFVDLFNGSGIYSVCLIEYWTLFVTNPQKFHEGEFELIHDSIEAMKKHDAVLCNSDFVAKWLRSVGVANPVVCEPLVYPLE
ncbi:MAG: hypothetical protein D6711_12905, partial [Chloroflexi bacterium]